MDRQDDEMKGREFLKFARGLARYDRTPAADPLPEIGERESECESGDSRSQDALCGGSS